MTLARGARAGCVLAVAIAGACEPPVPPQPAPHAHVASAPEPPVPLVPVADPTPFHRDDVLVAKVKPGPLARTPVPLKGSHAAVWSADGASYFVDGADCGRVFSQEHPAGVPCAAKRPHDVRFSPSGKRWVVLDDADGSATVHAADGSPVAHYADALVARFESDDALLFRGQCRLFRASLTRPSEAPAPVGPEVCGGADATADGSLWVVASPTRFATILPMTPYRRLTRVDAATGVAADVMRATGDDDAITDVKLAPGGKRVCLRAKKMECLEIDGGAVREFPKPAGDPYSLVWDDRGLRYLSTAGGDLVWADLATRSVRAVGLAQDVRYWGFVQGGARAYAFDRGAFVVDLASGETLELEPKGVLVSDVVPSPKGDRFLVGKDQDGARSYELVAPAP